MSCVEWIRSSNRKGAAFAISVLGQPNSVRRVVRFVIDRLHHINERFARRLLTQEFLGQMLGVRRGSVNLAASTLQEAGLITYSRGVSCECYAILGNMWKDIMGYSMRKPVGEMPSAQALPSVIRRHRPDLGQRYRHTLSNQLQKFMPGCQGCDLCERQAFVVG
jgi:hypothetical protein